MIQEGKEIIELFMEAIAHGLSVWFAAEAQVIDALVLERLMRITEDLGDKLSFLLLECGGGTHPGGHFA